MKNFRKVLALILVVATLFSFAAMTSAKEYKDSDKISYDQAVEVLSAIGILNGYDDGSFKPTDNIAREEMAKMVAVLSNAGDDVSELFASACKFADTKDRWSASYVAYCNETGIVAGRNASTFDPRGRVTGIETAKMLLCLIGFDATAQGYVGTNWKTNVLRDAKAAGLLDGFAEDYDVAKAITREEAANMMLNALLAPMVVGTISNNVVTFSNKVWIDLTGEAIKVGSYMNLKDAAAKYDCYVLYGNVVVSNIGVWQNYKGLYVDLDGQDCYGNPSVVWTYKKGNGTVLFKKAYTMNPTYTSTKSVDFEDLLSEELDSTKDYTLIYYVDGDHEGTVPVLDDTHWATLNSKSGKGVLTNVYIFDGERYLEEEDHEVVLRDTSHIIVTFKNTFIGKVDAVSNLGGKFILKDKHNGVNVFDNTDYGFKAGDIVLYWLCGENGTDLHDAKLATPVTGKVERTEVAPNIADSTAKVAGKTYEYAKNLNTEYTVNPVDDDVMDSSETTASTNNGTEYDVYLDEYGYIMGWTEHVVEDEIFYGYLMDETNYAKDAGKNAFGFPTYNYFGDYVDFSGKTNTDVAIEENTYDFMVAFNTYDENMGYVDLGRLVRYTVEDGKIVVLANRQGTGAHDYDPEFAPAGSYLDKDGDLVYPNGTEEITGTYKTQYLVRTWDQSSRKLVYNVYKYDELPSNMVSGRYSTFNNIQYFYETSDNGVHLLTYVFVDAVYTYTAETAFVTSTKAVISDATFIDGVKNNEYYGYNALINGEEAVLAVEHELTPYPGEDNTNFWVFKTDMAVIGVTDNGTPIYHMATAVGPTDYSSVIYYGDKLVFADSTDTSDHGTSLKVAEDCFVVIGDKTGDENVAKVLGDRADLNFYLEKHASTGVDDAGVKYYEMDQIWYVLSDNEVSELYINVIPFTAT